MLLHNKAQLLLLQQQEAGSYIHWKNIYGQLVYLRDVGGIVVLYMYQLQAIRLQYPDMCSTCSCVHYGYMEATARPAIVIIIHMQCVHCDYNRTL